MVVAAALETALVPVGQDAGEPPPDGQGEGPPPDSPGGTPRALIRRLHRPADWRLRR